MKYFWYAERLPNGYPKNDSAGGYPQNDIASGIVEHDTAEEAFEAAQLDAKSELGNTWEFVIKQFNSLAESPSA